MPSAARVAVALLLCAIVAGPAEGQNPFRHSGVDLLHPPDSAFPNEQVDPASGTLTVVATDLVLPGNAGFNLAIQRVYNSAIFPDYDSGSTALEEDSWAGIGWKLHFGRILHADSQSAGQMQIEMGDGSRHALYHSLGNPNIWTTTDFWLYNPATHVLQLPNGRIYTFDREVTINERLGVVRYVTEIRDPFNNRVAFDYFDASGPIDGIAAIHQYLGGAQVRDVTFTYDATLKALETMTFVGQTTHVWHYDHTASGPAGFSVLTQVRPPLGPNTVYEYSNGELTAIQAPFGGTIAYVYSDALRRAGSLTTTTRVVSSRTMSGHDVPTGTWTFAYSTGDNQDTTVISCPCGGTTEYRFNGTGVTGDFSGWSAGTLAQITVKDAGVALDTRTLAWMQSEAISNDPVSGPNGVWSDAAVYRPLLQQQVVTRGPGSWTTTFSYHTGQGTIDDYAHAYQIEERENPYRWRRTTRTFQYGFTPYILGAVASESLEQNTAFGQNDGTTASSWTYNLATGFVTSETARGITTTFEPRADGNLNAVVDARGKRTTFAYSWGRVSQVTRPGTPVLTTTFGVNAEGLITSTAQGALTTTYEYDAALRLSLVQPPTGNAITYQPDILHGTFVKVFRGASMVEHDVDGLGREVRTFNSQNLRVDYGRDTCGRVIFTSDPYTNASGTQGTRVTYDALGRVKTVTDSAGKVTTYSYSGASVTRTDANNHATTFDYLVFGDPNDGRVAAVTDAAQNATSYRYHVTGALSSVTGPLPGLQRTWSINVKGLPDSDTQPESGTTGYGYDEVGNLTTLTDANSQTTTFTYDGINRLLTRDAPGADDDLTVSYDSSGRVASVSSGGSTTTFTYDLQNRRVTRADATPAGSFQSIYHTDANDNLDELTYPSGRLVTYHYDAENRLTSVDHKPFGAPSSTPFAGAFTYADEGRLASYATGAVTHNFTYEFNRPKRIWTSGGADALDLTYGYDNVGNVLSISDPRSNASQTFVPDPLDRLESAAGPWGTLQWSYDAAGNRLSETASGVATTYTINAATQRLASTSGGANESFGYDNAGRLTQDGAGSYTYSPTGKLMTAAAAGVSASYAYDAAGERFSKTVNGQTTYSLRSLGGQTLSEYVGSCGATIWSRDLVYAAGQLLGAAKAVTVQPSVAMAASSVSVGEAAGNATVSVRLTTPNGAALGCPVTVSFATSAGSASAGADYTQTSGSVTFATGAASGSTQTISVPIVNDGVDEPDETFSVSLSSAAGATIGAPNATVVTILDDDPPQVSFAEPWASVAEDAGSVSIVVRLTTAVPLPSAVTVNYATANGSAIAGQDYTATSGTITFDAGSVNGATRMITVPITADSTFESDESFTVSLSSPSGAILGAPATHTMTIANDDLPTISFTAASASVGEGAGSITVTTRLATGIALPSAVSVQYSSANGSAAGGSDYSAVGGTLMFPAGSGNGAEQSLIVPILQDGLFEGNETFTVTLSNPSGAWIGSPGTQTVTIADDDLPTISFAAASSSVSESAGSVSVLVTLGTGIPLPSGVQALYTTGNISATSGQDYTAVSGSVGFNAGSANGATQTITVPIVNDGLYEGNETFYVTLYNPWSATIVSPGTHTVTIVEDDPTPNPLIQLEAPPDGSVGGSVVSISGWAIDSHAPSGTGITLVNVYAYPNADESQPAIFLGSASYGSWRGDVASSYGSQFGPSGYSLTVTMPGPGVYRVRAFGYDPLGGTFYASNPRDFTVQPTPRMNIDTPGSGTVAAWFTVQGWAIDAGAGSGTGVDLVQLYAYPNPGSGQPPIFLGTASYGGYRGDVAAAYGSQFGPSGYALTVNLGAGYYQVVVYAHSSVTASWSQAQSLYVTVNSGVNAVIDIPVDNATVGQPFTIAGWAVDTSSSSGNGVAFCAVYAYLNGATPYFIGNPSTGGSRPDIGAWLQDSRFTPSGWSVSASGLPPGSYLLIVYPYSTVSGYGAPLGRWITVQ